MPQVYPDMGVSAMLKNQWTDAAFGFASLNDRKPAAEDDDIVVVAAPDPQVGLAVEGAAGDRVALLCLRPGDSAAEMTCEAAACCWENVGLL